MAYRKFRADQLFDGFQMLGNDSVLVCDDQGNIEEIIPAADAGTDVMVLNGILSPGFINCHCHLELSHMRGKIPVGTGLPDFVWKVVSERHHAEEEILQAIEKAEDEMLQNGIVACGDICNNALTISQKLKGRIWYHNFIESSGFNPAIAEERFNRSLGFFEAYGKMYAVPISSNSIVPHAPYSVSGELWEKILHFPGNQLMTIHNQESIAEDEFFRTAKGDFLQLFENMKMDISYFKPTGKSSLQSYLSKFLPNQQVILVHNTHTTEEDLDFCEQLSPNLRLSWCFCPNANQYITGAIPDIKKFMQHDCEIVLGTDSLASNHQLNMLNEIKTIRNSFPDIAISELLKWATSNGSRALQVDSMMGSFEKDKKPGIVLITGELKTAKRLL